MRDVIATFKAICPTCGVLIRKWQKCVVAGAGMLYCSGACAIDEEGSDDVSRS